MRTFEGLRGLADTWCTSLAYWLGIYRGEATSDAILDVAAALSFQYDFEEQADSYGRVFPEDSSWATVFAPVAPIQLTRGWSPVPRAVELLGEPRVEAVGEDASFTSIRTIAVSWSMPDDAKPLARRLAGKRSEDPVEARFAALLAVAVARAAERRAQLLLIARPGWSYEHDHPVSAETATLMKKAGFVVTNRTPQS